MGVESLPDTVEDSTIRVANTDVGGAAPLGSDSVHDPLYRAVTPHLFTAVIGR